MFRIETNEFLLELEPRIFEVDMEYPVNTILGINVSSYGFCANTTMDINAEKLAECNRFLGTIPK